MRAEIASASRLWADAMRQQRLVKLTRLELALRSILKEQRNDGGDSVSRRLGHSAPTWPLNASACECGAPWRLWKTVYLLSALYIAHFCYLCDNGFL